MKSLLLFIVLIVQILLALINGYDFLNYIFLAINIVGTISLFKSVRSIKESLATVFLFTYIFCSLHVEALTRMQISSFVITEEGRENIAFHDLAIFANEVLFVFSLSFLVLKRAIKLTENHHKYIQKSLFSNRAFYVLLLTAYFFTFVCGVLGIGKMGFEAAVVLPFKLNGIMQFYRTDIFPLFIALYVYDRIKNNRNIDRKIFVLLLFWALLESIVRLSRGAVVTSFFPLLFMLIYTIRINKQFIVKIVFPLVGVAFLMFPVITLMRQSGDVSIEQVKADEKSSEKSNVGEHAFLRTFLSGIYYVRMYSTGYDDPSLFYFGRLPAVLALGGSAMYTTREIDGRTDNVVHSSGTSGILDPLVIGGKGLCFIMIVLLVFLAIYLDRRIGKEKLMYKVICIMIFKILVMSKNITVLLDTESIQLILCYAMEFAIVTYYYNKHYRPIPSSLANGK